MIGIHPIHRKMAVITWMSMNQNGELNLDTVAVKLLQPLLKQNLRMIQRLDELKSLSYIAYELNDTDWQHDICQRIEALERDLFEV
ncbi:hypothetical protein J2Z32_001934 [Paenibacillus turicensis]|uniref:Uncharacterized protein n=1 Tax=Paenibacillus turicensis TaxID=160487 RepID=A0ABS4FRV2_9BACL|nr:hypothetical protein [Paenibacillus turicensis]MBP1905306.1 hypothetical protein [Paenibacillus turicensis]